MRDGGASGGCLCFASHGTSTFTPSDPDPYRSRTAHGSYECRDSCVDVSRVRELVLEHRFGPVLKLISRHERTRRSDLDGPHSAKDIFTRKTRNVPCMQPGGTVSRRTVPLVSGYA